MTSEPAPEEKDRDLGFGSQIATQDGERLLQRDGSFSVRRVGRSWRAALSLYHSLITIPWPAFLALVTAAYLVVHVIFGFAYAAAGPGALEGPGSGFSRCFFFSVHTFSGIGYGHVVPMSLAANWITTFEALTGMLGLALVAGIVFARFSRPNADITFSEKAIVAPYRGKQGLMVRVANQRRNQLVHMRAEMMLSIIEEKNGNPTRVFSRLELERESISLFPMTWTIVHPLEADSPLAGRDAQGLEQSGAEILVLLSGTDETLSQVVYARTSYKVPEISWGVQFADIYARTEAGLPTGVDLSQIHRTDPV